MGELYEKFSAKLKSVDGECHYVAGEKELAAVITETLKKRDVGQIALFDSPYIKKQQLREQLTKSGYEVISGSLRQSLPASIGITEIQWGIAELGTSVQYAPEVDNRLCSTLVDTHIAILPEERILAELDDALDKIYQEESIPNFVGFMTGPSRSSDIERVLTVGVHGPKEQIVLVVGKGGKNNGK
jgi:L-lactate dehydrogenase complex protein LldG